MPAITTSPGKPVARAGLLAKGVVYCLLGYLVFRAAFGSRASAKGADKAGVFDFIYQQAGGRIMLGVIAAGLTCYCIWRLVQACRRSRNHGGSPGLAKRARYLVSGLVYGSLAVYAFRLLILNRHSQGNSRQTMVHELLIRPFGQLLVAAAGAVLLAVGCYQVWYGLSEKYRKHVNRAGNTGYEHLLLAAGKVGYVARGIVWLLIAWLFFKAALYANSAEAGDTGKAFAFLQHAAYGTYLTAAVGAGLICYGIFNFVRARYESL